MRKQNLMRNSNVKRKQKVMRKLSGYAKTFRLCVKIKVMRKQNVYA